MQLPEIIELKERVLLHGTQKELDFLNSAHNYFLRNNTLTSGQKLLIIMIPQRIFQIMFLVLNLIQKTSNSLILNGISFVKTNTLRKLEKNTMTHHYLVLVNQ
jgi:hypothetical protein